jgi:polyisoprenoid-binding protein YceI
MKFFRDPSFRRITPLSLAALLLACALAAAATQWRMQPQQSKLSFVATQAGAPFEGVFEKFTADIRFDPQDLDASRFEVAIDLSSVDTGDAERYEILQGPDLFAVQQWPSARFVAGRFSDAGGGKYTASGKLTLRNVTRDVPLRFTFEKNDTGAWLRGEARLQRLDFGVGQGEWRDTDAVANEVAVRFALLLQP